MLASLAEKMNPFGKEEEKTPMKVTLLSGFLGAGKTTLLKRILRINNDLKDSEKLKMAVIVNDMGDVNLDAEEIKHSKVIQEDAEMVEMQNGCICCTLRGDLLKTVKSLSEEGKFDYLVIESTGIGEPLPVAQTFAMDVDSMTEKGQEPLGQELEDPDDESAKKLTVATDEKKSLFYYAKLDTLVTVVDALNIYDVMSSLETLSDKDNVSGMVGNTGTDGDDIAANYPGGLEAMTKEKAAVVAAAMAMPVKRLQDSLTAQNLDTTGDKETLVKRLISAFERQIESGQRDDRSIAKLWLDQIEFANVIIVSKAQQFLKANGSDTDKLKEIEMMLQKLNPDAKIIIPLEDKYGDLDVSKTLINTGLFNMEEASHSAMWEHELLAEDHNPETLEYGISSTTFIATDMPFHPERLNDALNGFGDWFMALRGGPGESFPVFNGIVRTKGQIWLANSNAFPVSFQTSGQSVELKPGESPFYAERNQHRFTKEETTVYEYMVEKGLWSEKWGDRRSQLIFIGLGLDAKAIHETLNKALLTQEESEELGGVEGWKKLKDPFYGGQLVKKCESYHAWLANEEDSEKKEEE